MLLAIDTSTQMLSIALHDGAALVAENTLTAGRQHSALLAPLIDQIMTQVGVGADNLTALAVSVGPGSYTGARIGVALAKGMAAARDLPLVPLTTLETIVAAQSGRQSDRLLIATVAAGRNRVIWASYRQSGGAWIEQRAPQISSWGQLLAACKRPIVISGEISAAACQEIHAAQDEEARIQVLPAAERLRRAGFLAELAWRRLREADAADMFPADQVMPIYLRSPG